MRKPTQFEEKRMEELNRVRAVRTELINAQATLSVIKDNNARKAALLLSKAQDLLDTLEDELRKKSSAHDTG